MKSQKDWDNFFIDMALLVAEQSYDQRKVGCVITRGDAILAYSYNGTPRGWPNRTRDDKGETLSHVLHAEAHAIAKCARAGIATSHATLYCTYEPCIDCAKLIASSGICRVVYKVSSTCHDGIEHLLKSNVVVKCIYNEEDSGGSHAQLIPAEQLKHTGL